jgi:carbonic anhydrase
MLVANPSLVGTARTIPPDRFPLGDTRLTWSSRVLHPIYEEGSIMAAIDIILEANQKYAQTFTYGGMPGRPTRLRLAVVACMDCRLHISKLLGLELGDAHIIRNAGGIVTEDVLRSLIVSCNIAGTQEVMIINNTKCGMLTFKGEELAAKLQKGTGKAMVAPARFYDFSDLEENVRQQMRKVRSHPWIPDNIIVRGFIYDVDTGTLSEVSTSPDISS